jgi:demethylmenaquinone methyltransferase / 2-methoxy-6-polyprenyl-1,4-benzoquinol methylase
MQYRGTGLVKELFRGLPERYDALAEVLSWGQNRRWRRAMVDPVVDRRPARVLDVATGTCGVALQLAERTDAWIAGIDLSDSMVARGRANVRRGGQSSRIDLVIGRAEQLPFPDGCFDALTFTYLLRYVQDPADTLREMARVVRPGGIVASLDFSIPQGTFWRWWWWVYTRAILPGVGWILGGRAWARVGRFLGPSISSHHRRYPVEWTVDAWRDAALVDVRIRRMSFGSGLVMWGTKAIG